MTLVEQYQLSSDVHQLVMRDGSSLIGLKRDAPPLPTDLSLVTLLSETGAPIRETVVRGGQILVLRGPVEQAGQVAGALGPSFRADLPPVASRTSFSTQTPVWPKC